MLLELLSSVEVLYHLETIDNTVVEENGCCVGMVLKVSKIDTGEYKSPTISLCAFLKAALGYCCCVEVYVRLGMVEVARIEIELQNQDLHRLIPNT